MTNRRRVIIFLNDIGIKTTRGRVPKGFLPDVRISKGNLVYNGKATVADLLHEAGHLATVPAKYRALCTGDMENSIDKIWQLAAAANETEDPDHPICRQILQSSEAEAIAWSWAAGKHLGIPEKDIIPNGSRYFNGEGPGLRLCLKTNCHFGINGLRAAGMLKSVKHFPNLIRWVQPDA